MLTDAVAEGILDKAGTTLDLRETTERSLGILALKLRATVMDTSLTLINIWVKKSQEHCQWTHCRYLKNT